MGFSVPVSAVKDSEVDVLVVGAGPAGLMAAQGLHRAGVKVRVVDKRPQAVKAGHGDGIQPRTVEVLQSYGLGERLLREGVQVHMAAFYNPSAKGVGIERSAKSRDVTAPTARYPFEMTLHQGALEELFTDAMRDMGLAVDRPTLPVAIELSQDEAELKDPQSYPIKVTLQNLDAAEGVSDTEVVRAKYLIGCDGAHSFVRRNFGIEMEGEQTEYVWGVVDIIPDTDFPDIRNRCAIHSHNGSCMNIPREGDVIRLYIQLTDADVRNEVTGRVDMTKCSAEKLIEVAQKSFYPYKIASKGPVEWWTIYIIGQRVAAKYSVHDRVFIAGDACHTHSPKAGQGMNASMNDTHNLLWKMTHVLRGWADPSLLKTYEFERRKYAQDLIDFDKRFASLFSGKPQTEDNEDGVSHEEFLAAWQQFGNFTTGVGVHYAPSAIVNPIHQSLASGLPIGQRLIPQMLVRLADARPYEIQDIAPADSRFKVIIFAGDIQDKAQYNKVHALAETMTQPGSFLRKYTPKGSDYTAVFDVITIAASKKDELDYTDVPELLRPHWSKVYVDDVDFTGKMGGNAYATYGVDRSGVVVVVRPDQYVGMVAPFDKIADIDQYFSTFMSQGF
ncbi:hypothetical protein JAAARDRAFT_30898 [Jaapia argillacea MUCL 33604]|uniref:FAD-binding domain-containing protein n=1 Tax=Jaapia argillacea MUCL 33604 TaxID=933084 RepID=A0A067Q3C6_9AGAM|nr:hypothetical protein JAAARDRAFT_30898 [Jaapia argillacea MUCL 33604]